jgi:hypothetical protein
MIGCGAFFGFFMALAVVVALAFWEEKRPLLDDSSQDQKDRLESDYSKRKFACVWLAILLFYIYVTHSWRSCPLARGFPISK